MAIEDAACLGLVFNKANFDGNIRRSLETYERVRKPRASKVQAASARARENIHERIGKKAGLKSYRNGLMSVQGSRTTRIILSTKSKMRKTSSR